VHKKMLAALMTLAAIPLSSHAATQESFQLRNGQDLVDLCSVPDGDAMAEAARSFCYGYLRGVYEFHAALKPTPKDRPLFCVPRPGPTRAQAGERLVAWSKAKPQFMSEPAIDVLVRFAVENWPCATATKTKTKTK